jgi:hypothetical protein
MASFGNGARHFNSLGLVQREVTTTLGGNGPNGRTSGTQHALNVEMTENKAVLAEKGWKRTGLQYWTYKTAKKYVKMYHIDKLFLLTV